MMRGYPPEPMGFPDRGPYGPPRPGPPPGPVPGPGPGPYGPPGPGPGPNGGPMGFHGGPPPPPPPQGIGRHRSRRDETPGISLLIRNIGPEITVADLESAFRRIGDVRDVYIPRDYHSRQPKRFAFVEYANQQEAARAKQEMDKFYMKGRELEVIFAQEKRKTPVQMKGRGSDEEYGPASRSGGQDFTRSSSFERHLQREREKAGR